MGLIELFQNVVIALSITETAEGFGKELTEKFGHIQGIVLIGSFFRNVDPFSYVDDGNLSAEIPRTIEDIEAVMNV